MGPTIAPMAQGDQASSGGPTLPSASLIICSRNRARLLNELVGSILEGDHVPEELIIVDDSHCANEHLSSLTTSRNCELRYIWNRSIGLSRANNTGVRAARHDLLVFTQDDVLVTRSWFGTIVKALVEAGPNCVVSGRVLPGAAETPGGFAPSTESSDNPMLYRGRIRRDVLFLQNMAIYRSAVDKVGRFDPALGPGTTFPSAEDNDFGYRLLEAGYYILYEPRAVTYHRAWRSPDQFLRLHWNYGRGQGAYYGKYLSFRDRYMLERLARDVLQHAVRFPIRLLLRRDQAYADAFYISGVLSGAAEWLLTHPRSVITRDR